VSRGGRGAGLAAGVIAAVFAGVAGLFVVDPSVARRRFALLRDKATMIRTRVPPRVGRAGRAVSAEAYGLKQKIVHLRAEPSPDAEPELANTEDQPDHITGLEDR
jgi:hypothetical protein